MISRVFKVFPLIYPGSRLVIVAISNCSNYCEIEKIEEVIETRYVHCCLEEESQREKGRSNIATKDFLGINGGLLYSDRHLFADLNLQK